MGKGQRERVAEGKGQGWQEEKQKVEKRWGREKRETVAEGEEEGEVYLKQTLSFFLSYLSKDGANQPTKRHSGMYSCLALD